MWMIGCVGLSACRNVVPVVAGVRCVGRGRKTWGVCVCER